MLPFLITGISNCVHFFSTWTIYIHLDMLAHSFHTHHENENQCKGIFMEFFKGLAYNYQGLKLGLKTPKLLALGLLRLFVVMLITIASATLVVTYSTEIMNLIWQQPQSPWIAWAWHLLSWILTLIFIAMSAFASYILSQVLFSVVIMDMMSRVTEQILMGHVKQAEEPLLQQFLFLVKQEIPRTLLPLTVSMLLMAISWLTPLAPVITVLSTGIAIIFLSWDNTDLIPARRLLPFHQRFAFLRKHLLFHVGFGIWFLIPAVNLLFLSFAPIGAARYYLESVEQ